MDLILKNDLNLFVIKQQLTFIMNSNIQRINQLQKALRSIDIDEKQSYYSSAKENSIIKSIELAQEKINKMTHQNQNKLLQLKIDLENLMNQANVMKKQKVGDIQTKLQIIQKNTEITMNKIKNEVCQSELRVNKKIKREITQMRINLNEIEYRIEQNSKKTETKLINQLKSIDNLIQNELSSIDISQKFIFSQLNEQCENLQKNLNKQIESSAQKNRQLVEYIQLVDKQIGLLIQNQQYQSKSKFKQYHLILENICMEMINQI